MAKKVNNDPMDQQAYIVGLCKQYIDVKRRMDELEAAKKNLSALIKKAVPDRGAAKAFGDPEIAGRLYTVKITEVESRRLDQDLVKKFLSDEQLEVCQKVVKSERMTVETMDIVAEPATPENDPLKANKGAAKGSSRGAKSAKTGK